MPPVIGLEDVHKLYDRSAVPVYAVRGVTLTVKRGEFVAIMGPSGSGKSTLMNLLGCLDRPTRGRYLLDGVNVSLIDDDRLAAIRNRQLGFVFQGFNLLSRTTTLENVELPMLCGGRNMRAREVKARAERCLARVGLADRGGHFPNELSGGQQQRVAIARALVNDPEIILADEPTGNLDSKASAEIMDIFRELNGAGITIVMVTHEPYTARYCKRRLLMRDGRLVRDESLPQRRYSKPDSRKASYDPI